MTPRDDLPLPTMLSRALGYLTSELEGNAGAGLPPLAVWSNVLRPVDAGTDDERGLAEAARISSRLATAAITGAARHGWITASPASGKKNRRLAITDAGRAATDVWRAQLDALDAKWAGTPLRDALESLVARVPFELPYFPASYGTADPSAVGGSFVPAKDGIPSHGKDWRPVRRGDDDTVSGLPLTALLSQALTAFTIDYERGSWPLASTARVLVHLSAEPRPLADVPGDHEIAGNGRSLLERHLIAVVTKDPTDGRTPLVALTPRGVAVLQHHPVRLAAVEAEWRERFGASDIDRLREALAPLAELGRDQPDHVIGPLHLGGAAPLR